jgi:hypothetical protein
MIKKKKILLILLLLKLFFLVVGSVSAADFNVYQNTSLDEIHNWMNNTAQSGDKLIFNGVSYTLNDTLVISKSIIMGSRQNTTLIFNKNKTMIDIQTGTFVIIGLSIIHRHDNNMHESVDRAAYDSEKNKYISTISTSTREKSFIRFNMINSRLSTAYGGIEINIRGNIVNSRIRSDNFDCISSSYWIGHLYKSELRGKSGIDNVFGTSGGVKWRGNIINSNISVLYHALRADYYKGTIYKSRLINLHDPNSMDVFCALRIEKSKFTINRSTIQAKGYTPMLLGTKKQFRVIRSNIIAGKGYPKYASYKNPPRLH